MTTVEIIKVILELNFEITKGNHPYYQFDAIGGLTKSRIGTKFEQLLWNKQRIININVERMEKNGFACLGVKEDGGTRTSFNGIFRNLEELKTILNCVA